MVYYVAPGIIFSVLEPLYIIYRNPTCKELSNNNIKYSCEVGATERGCSGSIGSDDTRGYGAGSGDVGKELPRGMIP